jgi:hypothetical protein
MFGMVTTKPVENGVGEVPDALALKRRVRSDDGSGVVDVEDPAA